MRGIWAVARYTLAQCLRTKVAAAFTVALAVALVLLPLALRGDGTLAGRVRTFLAYSTASTGILLSLATVLLSVGLVAGDVQARHVFLLAVKPLPRWQYIVGRWAGVVLMDAAVLVVAAAVIFGVAQHLRTQEATNDADRMAVESEVFAAREEIKPEPESELWQRYLRARMEVDGGEPYRAAVDAYMDAGLSEKEAHEQVQDELRREFVQGLQSVAPGQRRTWRLSGIDAQGRREGGRATVRGRRTEYIAEVELTGPPELRERIRMPGFRSSIKDVQVGGLSGSLMGGGFRVLVPGEPEERLRRFRQGSVVPISIAYVQDRTRYMQRAEGKVVRRRRNELMAFESDPELTGRMTSGGYLTVADADGLVEYLREGRFTLRFFENAADSPKLAALSAGDEVEVEIGPMVRLRFELEGGATGGIRGMWRAYSPDSGYPPHREEGLFPRGVAGSVSIPERVIGPEGDLRVEFTNLSNNVVTVTNKDLSLLYPAGGFTLNYLRGMFLLLVQFAFLAAIGVFAGSFLSLPIGCLVCFSVLPLSVSREFLADAAPFLWSLEEVSEKGHIGTAVGLFLLGSLAMGAGAYVLSHKGMAKNRPFLRWLLGLPLMLGGFAALAWPSALLLALAMPDFARTSPSNDLADGLLISWGHLARTFAITLFVQCGTALGLGCLIFHKRELARVQV